jgi:hypothetical protein
MNENGSDVLYQVQNYRKIVLLYEALDAEIDRLISQHGGTMDKMSSEDLAYYRKLAAQRDELYNEMRLMEKKLLDDDEQG